MQYGSKNISELQYGSKNIIAAYWGSKKVWELGNVEDYCTIEALEDGLTVSFSNTVKYSTNCKIWKTLEANTISKEFKSGQKLYFKANLTPTSENGIGTFSVNKNFKLYGNVMSLLFSNEGKDNDDLTGYNYAFKRLFQGCTTLQEVSNDFLNKIKVLSEGCYEEMFLGCTSLTNTPELPIITLTRHCYLGMFDGCSSLELASELPATELVEGCYERMFKGCTSLKSVLSLPATILVANCYRNMFYNCSNLNFIEALFITPPLENYTKDWVYGVSTQGVFVKNDNATWLIDEHRNSDGIPEGWNVYDKSESDVIINNYLIIDPLEDKFYVQFTYDCNYSLDGFNWLNLYSMRRTITVNTGRKLYFKADNLIPNDVDGIGQFIISGKCNLLGNCNAMLFGDNAKNNNDISVYPYAFKNLFAFNDIIEVSPLFLPATKLAKNCYENMFYQCISLQSSPNLQATTRASNCYNCMLAYTKAIPSVEFIDFNDITGLQGLFAYTKVTDEYLNAKLPKNPVTGHYCLPAETLTPNCYSNMFEGCTSLTTTPELPALNLANYCYSYMFQGCTALIVVPDLPAMALADYCYYHMFDGCTALENAPDLPATTLANSCYNCMFFGCTALETVPDRLPATELANYCYYAMFEDCKSLIHADIELPARTLKTYCYANMFYQCDLLESMPNLPATELASHCYYQMCYNCKKLIEVPNELPALNLKDFCYRQMFGGCASLTTAPIIKATAMTGSSTCSYMFSGCSSLTTVQDELYAMTLVDNCYERMFNACTSLTTAPNLPALNLAPSCYKYMFGSCTSLTTAPDVLPALKLKNSCYSNMFYYCHKLTTAPELPAPILTTLCYEQMFRVCTKLNKIIAGFIIEPGESYTYQWVSGVATKGEFIQTSNQEWTTRGVNAIPTEWTIIKSESTASIIPEESNNLIIQSIEDTNINIKFDGGICQYSTNDKDWSDLPKDGIYIASGTKIYFKGDLTPGESGIGKFIIGGKCNLSGNCNAMINYNNDLTNYSHAYKGLFEGQPIVNVSLDFLSADVLSTGCYEAMFKNCTDLKNVPELPAETLANGCYKEMFYGCTILKLAPELRAATLVEDCYDKMFYECYELCYIYALFDSASNTSCATDWVTGVHEGGIFITCNNMNDDFINNYVPQSWTVKECKDVDKYLIIKSHENNNTIKFTNSCQYSLNTVEWYTFDNDNGYQLQCGEFIYFKSTDAYVNNEGVGRFSSTGKFNLSGNCNAMLFGDDAAQNNDLSSYPYAFAYLFAHLFDSCYVVKVSKHFLPSTNISTYCYYNMFANNIYLKNTPELPAEILKTYCYSNMFSDCYSLVDVYELKATRLANYCCEYMFQYCLSLVTAPELPAEILASYCYRYMFSYCTSLTTAPELPAKTLTVYCYQGMFNECSLLTKAPDILPATTLITSCYSSMFSGCTSLTTAPSFEILTIGQSSCNRMFYNCIKLGNINNIKLTADRLYYACYLGMFQRCTSLEIAPDLPATILAGACYQDMFNGCTSLITTTEELPGDKLLNSSYFEMFYNCKSLKKAPKILATQTSDEKYNCYQMFYGCTSLEEIDDIHVKNWGNTSCYNMFANCTSLKKAPNLYATEVKGSSYYHMFNGCTSLEIAPDLPATTLAASCYSYMFYNCNKLKVAPVLPSTILSSNCYSYMFSGCTSLIASPDLPAKNLVSNCYKNMLYDNKNLKYINASFENAPSVDYQSNWVFNVSNSSTDKGTFVKSDSANWDPEDYRNNSNYYSGIPAQWRVINNNDYQEIIKDYLTIEALERELVVSFSNNCQYSFDCIYWYDLEPNTPTLEIGKGRKLYFKGNLIPDENGIGQFTINKKFNLLGNCNSMICNDDADIQTSLTNYSHVYKGLFENQPVVNIESVFLSSIILSEGCYERMFKNCQYLETSPVLPAKNLVSNCYKEMFYNCGNLNHIKALFNDAPSDSYMENWVYGVANQGIFEISPEIEWNIEDYRGVNGIPENWNIL